MTAPSESASSRVVGGRTLRNGTRKSYVPPPIESSDEEERGDTVIVQPVVTSGPSTAVKVKVEDVDDQEPKPSRKRKRASSETDDFELDRKKQKQRRGQTRAQKDRARAEAKVKAEEKARKAEEEKIYNDRVRKEAKWKAAQAKKEPSMPWKKGQKIHLFDLPAEILEQILSLEQDLSIKDYMCISATCWYLRLPFLDDSLWRQIYRSRKKTSNLSGVDDREGILPASISNQSGVMKIGPTQTLISCTEACYFGEVTSTQGSPTKVLRVLGHGMSKPVIKSEPERVIDLLNQYNRICQYSQYKKQLAKQRYYRCKNASTEEMQECREVLHWSIARLPLSRTEAVHFGIKTDSLPLHARIWDYGPWQILARRDTNWPIIPASKAVGIHWLSPEDLDTVPKVPDNCCPDPESLPKDAASNAHIGYHFKEDVTQLTKKLKQLIIIRKKPRTKAMSLLSDETRVALQRQGKYRSWCDLCQSCHDSPRNKPYKHNWFYTYKEYRSAELDNIKGRIRAQQMKETGCSCGECWGGYDEYDSEFDSYYY